MSYFPLKTTCSCPTYTSNPGRQRIVKSSKALKCKPSLSPKDALFCMWTRKASVSWASVVYKSMAPPHLLRHTDHWSQVWVLEPGLVSLSVSFCWTEKWFRPGLGAPIVLWTVFRESLALSPNTSDLEPAFDLSLWGKMIGLDWITSSLLPTSFNSLPSMWRKIHSQFFI